MRRAYGELPEDDEDNVDVDWCQRCSRWVGTPCMSSEDERPDCVRRQYQRDGELDAYYDGLDQGESK